MVEINSTLLIQIVNFLILVFVLNVLLYKPILRIIDKRNQYIAKSDQEVKDIHRTVEQKMAEYEEKVRQAKLEAMNQRNEIEQGGTKEGEQIIEEVKSGISRMIDDFHVKISKEIDKARGILKDQSQKISIEIAEKVLGRSIQ